MTPISPAEFASLMAPFAAPRTVVAAVSGGADSMALAWLLREWGEPLAVIVDHGLRPESAAEAGLTARRLTALGIPAQIVTLAVAPGPDLAARARSARYAALLAVCREVGRPDLLLAHHAADQAETVALRRAAGSGPAGLAGMAALSWRDDARLLRPLLGVEPGRLRATLQAAGVAWVEDPANPGSARGRLRTEGVPADEGSDATGAARARMEAIAASELARKVALSPGGYGRIDGPLSPAAWSALIWCVSGRAYPPPPAAVDRFARTGEGTLHGVRARGGWVAREPAGLPPPVSAEAGTVWDGRFMLRSAVPGGALGALGSDARRRRPGPPTWVLQGVAVLRRRGDLLAGPDMPYEPSGLCPTVHPKFSPACPLAGAPFRARGMHKGDLLPMYYRRLGSVGNE